HVEDTRDELELFAYEPNWTYRFRSNHSQAWSTLDQRLFRPADGPEEHLMLWVPKHYLGEAPDQVTATPPTPPRGARTAQAQAQWQRDRDESRANSIPDTYFASGLTGLPRLYDEVLTALHNAGLPARRSRSLRNQLMQKLWNLDTHLDEAVNEGGYRFTLTRRGNVVAEVIVRSQRATAPTRVGTTSKLAHLEKVRTAISGVSSG